MNDSRTKNSQVTLYNLKIVQNDTEYHFFSEKLLASEREKSFNVPRNKQRFPKDELMVPKKHWNFSIWCREDQLKEAAEKLWTFAVEKTEEMLKEAQDTLSLLNSMERQKYVLLDNTKSIEPFFTGEIKL